MSLTERDRTSASASLVRARGAGSRRFVTARGHVAERHQRHGRREHRDDERHHDRKAHRRRRHAPAAERQAPAEPFEGRRWKWAPLPSPSSNVSRVRGSSGPRRRAAGSAWRAPARDRCRGLFVVPRQRRQLREELARQLVHELLTDIRCGRRGATPGEGLDGPALTRSWSAATVSRLKNGQRAGVVVLIYARSIGSSWSGTVCPTSRSSRQHDRLRARRRLDPAVPEPSPRSAGRARRSCARCRSSCHTRRAGRGSSSPSTFSSGLCSTGRPSFLHPPGGLVGVDGARRGRRPNGPRIVRRFLAPEIVVLDAVL